MKSGENNEKLLKARSESSFEAQMAVDVYESEMFTSHQSESKTHLQATWECN